MNNRDFEQICNLLPAGYTWGCSLTPDVALYIVNAALASQAQQPELVAWGYAWQCKGVGDWRIEKLGDGCIPPKDTLALYVIPPAPEVCSDGGKCGAGGYCITCPNMPAPEGEKNEQ